jgi:hypothetical protein
MTLPPAPKPVTQVSLHPVPGYRLSVVLPTLAELSGGVDMAMEATDATWVQACTLPTVDQPARLAAFDALFTSALREVRREEPGWQIGRAHV